jgi:hypothetical protein
MPSDSAAIFARHSKVVSADGDEAGVGDLHLTMKLDEQLGLATVPGTEAAAAEDEDLGCGPWNSESLRRLAVWSVSS